MSDASPLQQKLDTELGTQPVPARLGESLDLIVECVELLSNGDRDDGGAITVNACDLDISQAVGTDLDTVGGEDQTLSPTGDGVLIDRSDIIRAVAVLLVVINLLTIVGYWRLYGSSKADIPPGPQIFKTDINTAPASELSLLPGVGYELATRIVESRQAVGPYQTLEDLRRVRGIGPKTVQQIEPMVVFGPTVSPRLETGGSE